MDSTGRIYVALDGLSFEEVGELIDQLNDSPHAKSIGAVKIHDLWDRSGPNIVRALKNRGVEKVWVDLKLHDVPTTVRLRAQALKDAEANIVTVHIAGGIEMMQAALKANITVFGITVLTSLEENEIHLDSGHPAKATVLARARTATLAGIHGIVCSAHEVELLSKRPELEGLKLVVPGIRLGGKVAADDNQKRVDTPHAAFKAGAHCIVVGSELTKTENLRETLAQIVEEIECVET